MSKRHYDSRSMTTEFQNRASELKDKCVQEEEMIEKRNKEYMEGLQAKLEYARGGLHNAMWALHATEGEVKKLLSDTCKELADTREELARANEEIARLKESTAESTKTHKTASRNTSKSLDDYINRQQRIFDNKVNHGFNTTNIYQEARYILEEVTELMRAIEKNDRDNMMEELADIVIFAYGCAEVARLGDLDAEIFKKMTINEHRKYTQNSSGDFNKVESGS